ncbi:hypothetical protein EVAR_97484_1 [Eumeta japonica]|uniref:Uncharacterized protein n=1 Tax=Eumeta variegata TaxID=151549 RepID=A0A4C1Z9E2_EUMVA|nr:hypothetical protein EVAR_97484_1 [Eumeta japonica]
MSWEMKMPECCCPGLGVRDLDSMNFHENIKMGRMRLCCAGRARKESQRRSQGHAKGKWIFKPRGTRSGRTRRPRSTLTSARPRGNRDERAAQLRSILQSSEDVTDGDCQERNTILLHT